MATKKTHPDNDPIDGEKAPSDAAWYYQCTSSECNLRFPAPDLSRLDCPICRSPVVKSEPWENYTQAIASSKGDRTGLSVVMDNLRSAYNVGSILRTADGAGFEHAYLCGITPTPDHPRLAKTSLSAEIHTSWSHHGNGVDLVRRLKAEGFVLIALETSPDAQNLFSAIQPVSNRSALVVGNEIYGIDPAIMMLCDHKLYLPMAGIKKSLNVAVSFGIAAYFLIHQLPVQSGS
jgi:23S rRNA (guanosine2251-2'-O)-methyltransferase